MRCIELLRLVALNINQNKFKSVMTSIGIVVGAATIVLVIGIGKDGQADVAEQFANLNAGAIDISYEYKGEEESGGGGFSFGNFGQMFGNMFGGMFGGGGGAEEFSGEASFGGSSSASGSFPGEMPEGDFAGGDFTPGEMPEGNFAGEILLREKCRREILLKESLLQVRCRMMKKWAGSLRRKVKKTREKRIRKLRIRKTMRKAV